MIDETLQENFYKTHNEVMRIIEEDEDISAETKEIISFLILRPKFKKYPGFGFTGEKKESNK